jgi:hypothetical protein
MPCKHFKEALIEAAASGAEPRVDLRSHLAECADCRAAFEQERTLFASIDASLHITANAEVPTSLLPSVRVRLDVEATPQRRWNQLLVFAAASVALAFAIFLFARPHHSGPDNQAKRTPQIPVSEAPTTNGHGQNPVAGTQIVSSNANHARPRGHSTLLGPVASSQPEVLVPADEREAFARFIARLRERGEVAVALVAPATPTKDDSANLERLQIDRLEVKPLARAETEQSNGTVQKQ